ncbi:hypothetical protein K438DRAFT_409623 [Mycena galopus ATCC 62051]|nr:hypothetical protein K438DRAFT_409623 [Mycena galopus ATCC 62051]
MVAFGVISRIFHLLSPESIDAPAERSDTLLQEWRKASHNSRDTQICAAGSSPVHSLPIEIISLIFAFTSPPLDAAYGLSGIQKGPWVCSAVCSRWRNIALSQPCLWTTVFLDFTDEDWRSATFEAIKPRLEAYLERSQQLPLNITFRAFWHEAHCRKRELRVLDLLALHCDRWETINFTGSAMLYDHLDGLRGNFAALRALSIRVRQENCTPLKGPLDIFGACPRLQEAFVNAGCYGGDRPTAVELPFSQLQRYGGSNSWANHANALRSTSNLVDCVLQFIGSISFESTILLPHLLRLSVSRTDVLDFLDTPALKELYCCDHSSHLHAFLPRLPTLQKLFVANLPTTSDHTRLLDAAAIVTNMCLHLPAPFLSDLFSILENPSGAAKIPVLHTLSLGLLPIGQLPDEDQLMRSVESQWRDGRLRCLKLYGGKAVPSTNTLERMELLRKQGMEIVLFSGSSSFYADMIPEDFRLYNDPYDFLSGTL